MTADGAEAQVEALVRRYIDAFNAGDFEAALACYRLPFTWFFGAKAVTVSSRDEFLSMMAKTKQALVREGLARSELTSTTVRTIGPHIALAGLIVTRVHAGGGEMERMAATYLVHNDGESWRLAANFMHPEAAMIPAGDL